MEERRGHTVATCAREWSAVARGERALLWSRADILMRVLRRLFAASINCVRVSRCRILIGSLGSAGS